MTENTHTRARTAFHTTAPTTSINSEPSADMLVQVRGVHGTTTNIQQHHHTHFHAAAPSGPSPLAMLIGGALLGYLGARLASDDAADDDEVDEERYPNTARFIAGESVVDALTPGAHISGALTGDSSDSYIRQLADDGRLSRKGHLAAVASFGRGSETGESGFGFMTDRLARKVAEGKRLRKDTAVVDYSYAERSRFAAAVLRGILASRKPTSDITTSDLEDLVVLLESGVEVVEE